MSPAEVRATLRRPFVTRVDIPRLAPAEVRRHLRGDRRA